MLLIYDAINNIVVAHDFFAPQPIKDADIFMFRAVLHDWPDNDVKKILSQLRVSATPKTKLVLIEQIPSYACVDTTKASKVEGYNPPPVPTPLMLN